MKLRSEEDRIPFLIDIGRVDLLESLDVHQEIADELFEDFIKKRRPLIKLLSNFRQSQLTKQQWRSSRWKFMRGVRKFHRSIQAKRMHRAMGRFLATRIFRPKHEPLKKRYESLDPLQFDALKALSSYKTHLYIEGDYYQSIEEEAEYRSLLDYSLPLLNSIEMKIYTDPEAALHEDEMELLLRFLDERELCKSISEILSVPFEVILEHYRTTCTRLTSHGASTDETYFLSRVMELIVPYVIAELPQMPESEETRHIQEE